MGKSIYLVNPAESTPGYFSLEVFRAWNIRNIVGLADLTMTTVAAMVPSDWQIELCDERAMPLNRNPSADVVGLTGKVSQRDRVVELAAHYRALGKLVIIGGPYATLNPDDMRPHCDILVKGELEEIATTLFDDIAAGRWRAEYEGGKPDLRLSPLPRWDLYPCGIAFTGQLQTSRGCPFECEFCDVIQYLGRKQRHKPIDQIIAELDQLYAIGFRGALLADDNFTVYRKRARAVLTALRDWNRARSREPMAFSTQVSIDIARDDDMLTLLREAGFDRVFVGIETPSEDSLSEVKKRQNLHLDLAAEVERIVSHGLMVLGGIIVGFDADDESIFERQREFIQRLPIPNVTIGNLVAPSQTPLHARLAAEGRLAGGDRQFGADPLHTNIIPKRMSREALMRGTRWLCNQAYAPHAFLERIVGMARCFPRDASARIRGPVHPILQSLFKKLAAKGPAERDLLARAIQMVRERPELFHAIGICLVQYSQVRHMYESTGIWDPRLAEAREPLALSA